MDYQNFKNEHSKFPVSTETFDFIQEQIYLLQQLTAAVAANGYALVREVQNGKDGLIIHEGELLPLKAGTGAQSPNILIREQSVDVTAGEVTVEDARVLRWAEYCPAGRGLSKSRYPRLSTDLHDLDYRLTTIEHDYIDSAGLSSALAPYLRTADLNTLLQPHLQHHIPKGTIIDWYGECRQAMLPYGFVPCGQYGYDLTAQALEDEINNWRREWTDPQTQEEKITIARIEEQNTLVRIRITMCNGMTVPDLTDRFIVQAGSAYNLGSIGGANEILLNSNQCALPQHNHQLTVNTTGAQSNAGDGGQFVVRAAGGTPSYRYSGFQEQQQAAVAHENRPPFFALYKLIKVI